MKTQVLTGVNQHRSLRVLPNRLTPVYSKNHYKKENFLTVKTVIFKYITPPHSNGCYVPTFLYTLYTKSVSPVCGYVQYIARDQSYNSATPRPIAPLVPSVPHPAH